MENLEVLITACMHMHTHTHEYCLQKKIHMKLAKSVQVCALNTKLAAKMMEIQQDEGLFDP